MADSGERLVYRTARTPGRVLALTAAATALLLAACTSTDEGSAPDPSRTVAPMPSGTPEQRLTNTPGPADATSSRSGGLCESEVTGDAALRRGKGAPKEIVALSEDVRLVVVDAATGEETAILLDRSDRRGAGISYFDFSPDGEHFYFAAYGRRSRDHVCHVDLTTGETRDLGPGSGPSLSPDGSRLAMGVAPGGGTPSLSALAVVDVATDERRVWTFPSDHEDFFQINGWITQTAWSPDGTTISYMLNYEGQELRLLAVDGTDSLTDARFLRGFNDSPAWSSDGRLFMVRDCCYPEWRRPGVVKIYEPGRRGFDTLETSPDARWVDTDASGDHVLVITGEEGTLEVLGDDGTTRQLGSGFIQAKW